MRVYNHYEATIKFNPKESSMSVIGTFTYVHKEEPSRDITFYLHKNTDIREIKGDAVKRFTFDQKANGLLFLSDSRPVVITLDKELYNNDTIDIEFIYQITLANTDFPIGEISTNYLEVNIYLPWFLLTKTLEASTFDVKVEIDKSEMELISGKGLKETDYGYHLIQDYPSYDATFIGARSLSTRALSKEFQDLTLKVVAVDESDAVRAEAIFDNCVAIGKHYKVLFSSKMEDDFTVVCSPRTEGGGYNRVGLTVLDNTKVPLSFPFLSEEEKLFIYCAHELGHAIFHRANVSSYDDWLNEGFAQWAMLLVFKSVYGDALAEKVLNHYKVKAEGLPSIIGMSRDNNDAYRVLYMKAPVLIMRWMDHVGEEAFMREVNAFLEGEEQSTRAFIQHMKDSFGKEVARMIFDDLANKTTTI